MPPTATTAASTVSASSGRQIRRSGSHGRGWLYRRVEPSARRGVEPGSGAHGDRRGRVPLVLTSAVQVHVGLAEQDARGLRTGRAHRHQLGSEHLGDGGGHLRAAGYG